MATQDIENPQNEASGADAWQHEIANLRRQITELQLVAQSHQENQRQLDRVLEERQEEITDLQCEVEALQQALVLARLESASDHASSTENQFASHISHVQSLESSSCPTPANSLAIQDTYQVFEAIHLEEIAYKGNAKQKIFRLAGWAFETGQSEPATIEVSCDGLPKWRGQADLQRPDVARFHAAIADATTTPLPFCGFNLRLPLPRNARRISVSIATQNGEKILLEQRVRRLSSAHASSTRQFIRNAKWMTPARYVYQRRHRLLSRAVLSPRRWQRAWNDFFPGGERQPAASTAAPLTPYQAHIASNDLTSRLHNMLVKGGRQFSHQPKFSVIMPVYDANLKWLEYAVRSVQEQIYENWELCIADDASRKPAVRSFLKKLENDPKIRVVFRPSNGHISEASNSAAELAIGEWLVFMDQDDVLAPHALFEFARLLQSRPEADVIYSDEDKTNEKNERFDPFFKPDYSPELLLAFNYINHLVALRGSLFHQVGGFRKGLEGSQDSDLLHRVAETTDRFFHIPKVLYHWRALPTSTASRGNAKSWLLPASLRALADRLTRQNINATIMQPAFAKERGLPIKLLDWPDNGPSVAIIIPTHDHVELLRACVESILGKTTYENYRVVVIDNDSIQPATHEYLNQLPARGVTIERISNNGEPFSFSRINNLAVQAVSEEYVLFLNNDIEVREAKWLSRLVGYAGLPGVGAVGARLQYPDGSLQHGGVVLNMRHSTTPGHAFRNLKPGQVSYYFLAEVARPCAAVTGACLLTKRTLFEEMGRFDEEQYPVSLNDVDYCLRLAERGLRSVYVGHSELVHHESQTRGRRDNPAEIARFRQQHGSRIDHYYNPNLSDKESFQIDSGCHLDYEEYLDRPLKVLLGSHNLNREGAPHSLLEIADGLTRTGKMEIEVLSPCDGPLRENYQAKNISVKVEALPDCPNLLHGWPSHAAYEESVHSVEARLKANRPDVLIANTLNSFYLVEAAFRAGVPALWIIRESYTPEQMQRAVNSFALEDCRRAFDRAHRVIFVSDETRKLFEYLNTQHNFTVLHKGLPSQPFKEYCSENTPAQAREAIGAPQDAKIIVTVGTVCERKDQMTLVRAAALLREKRSDFCCYIVGLRENLPYAQEIQKLAHDRKLDGLIKFIPETNDVRPYLRAADIFAFTSHTEAGSRVLLEAQACGLPILTTPCGGVREIVYEGANAIIFPFSDAPALAWHMGDLLDNATKRGRMGAASHHVFNFLLSYEEMIAQYERLLWGAWMNDKSVAETIQ